MHAAKNHRCAKKEKQCISLPEEKETVTVNCVCPKCGIHHKMKLLWTGRGKPKKFCQPCKTFIASIEQLEFYGVPNDVNKGLEKAV